MFNYSRELIRSPQRAIAHLVAIAPPVQAFVHPRRERIDPVQFCKKYKLDVAINANLYNEKTLELLGLYVSSGSILGRPAHGQYSLGVTSRGSILIAPSQEVGPIPQAVSGNAVALEGRITPAASNQVTNLTLIGLSKDGSTLFLCVIDSNWWQSPGLSVRQGVQWLLQRGAETVLQMDGGSSSLLGTRDRILNCPSTRILGGHAVPYLKRVPPMIGFRF